MKEGEHVTFTASNGTTYTGTVIEDCDSWIDGYFALIRCDDGTLRRLRVDPMTTR
jgi:hypothetical protein